MLSASDITRSRIIRLFIGLFGFCLGITILFFVMRAVLGVGGFCAEGGPYQIAVHCPKNTALLAPLSIFAFLISFFLYSASTVRGGPNYIVLFWCAIFTALGYNFFEFAFNPPRGDDIVISWLICGILFAVLGIGPLIFIGAKKTIRMLLGTNQDLMTKNETVLPIGKTRALLILLHVAAVVSGIITGVYIYSALAY